jgi:hypothetical protein
MLHRRSFLGAAAGATAFGLAGGPPILHAAEPDDGAAIDMSAASGVMRFRVDRGGGDIGTHEIRFERAAHGRIKVAVDIDLAVTFGPFTVYSYTHRNRTVWSDGRILHLSTRTDDDGDVFEVEATRRDDGDLEVSTKRGMTTTAPADILPTTYWLTATPEQTQLLNTQKGNVAAVTAESLGERSQRVPGGRVTARGYKMTGDVQAHIWYDPDGRWVGLSFDGKGKRVTYTLEHRSGFLPTSPVPADHA